MENKKNFYGNKIYRNNDYKSRTLLYLNSTYLLVIIITNFFFFLVDDVLKLAFFLYLGNREFEKYD